MSSREELKCGLPPGSIHGPLLFNIYINDLPLVCKKIEFILFADDTTRTPVRMHVIQDRQKLQNTFKWLKSEKISAQFR